MSHAFALQVEQNKKKQTTQKSLALGWWWISY